MKTIFLFGLMLLACRVYSQRKVSDTAWVKGRITTERSNVPGIFEIMLPLLRLRFFTGAGGEFALERIPFGIHTLIVSGAAQQADTFRVLIDLDTTDLGQLPVRVTGMSVQEADLLSSAGPADAMQDSPDQFPGPADPTDPMDMAARSWAALGYRYRGHSYNQRTVGLNGQVIQDLQHGTVPGNIWAGVYGLVLAATNTSGLSFSEVLSGGLAGISSVQISAAGQVPQTKVSYGRSNDSWTNRLLLQHSSGMGNKRWALAFTAGRSWSGQGYVPGTYYDGYSFYLGISYKTGAASNVQFTVLATPQESGRTAAITAEAGTLAGSHYYNPNWGYQEGQRRNAAISTVRQPLCQLQYNHVLHDHTRITLSALCRIGHSAYTALDWYNAADPRPDYYKNMPGAYKDDPVIAAQIREEWRNNPAKRQLDWPGMYEANRLNRDTAGLRRSVYTLGSERSAIQQYHFTAQVVNRNRFGTVYAGGSYGLQHTEHYRQMVDLLGGDYYVDINQFAEQAYPGHATFNQNDLNHPDRRVYAGDKYGYAYTARFNQVLVWSGFTLSYGRFRLFLAADAGYHAFSREGHYRTGLFPADAYGRSKPQHFFTRQVKAGGAYAPGDQHYLFLNAGTGTTAPGFDHTFIAPKSRNASLGNPVVAQSVAAETGYRFNTRRLKASLAVFGTYWSSITDIRRFYHEDYRSFVNYVMEGICIRNMGAELALEAELTPFLKATVAATWMEVVYRSRPQVSIYRDNDTSRKVDKHTAYLNNYYLAGPQSALLFGLDFRVAANGYAGIRCRLLDRNYTDINPARRTDAAVGLTLPGSPEQERILQQERLPQTFVLDISVGKLFYIGKPGSQKRKRPALSLKMGIVNLLNNKNVVTHAYEQLRFDFKGQDADRFPNKYTYAYGLIYKLELAFRL